MSFNELLEQNKSSDYIKLSEGDNRVRILCYPIKTISEFTNNDGTVKKSVRFVTWAIDRKDGAVKPLFFGKKILEQFAGLETDEENKFDSMPMPYDVNIKRIGSGKEDTSYNLIAGRNLTPITTEENNAFLEKDSIEEFVKKLEEKKSDETTETPAEHQSPSKEEIEAMVKEIPF